MAPSAADSMELAEFFFDGLSNVNKLDFVHSGHMAVLPEVPVVTQSIMAYGPLKLLVKWSRNETQVFKITIYI